MKNWRLNKNWLVLWSLWATRLVRQPTEIVLIDSGALRGSISHDGSHRSYLGIPYATVNQRFKASGPGPKWINMFEAVNEYVMCSQIWFESFVVGQEDCLVVNVFTPLNTNLNEKLPVMVFIHGGGFFFGSGGGFVYGPEYLVAKDVILVTINYRLDTLGFLCLGIKEAPGNAGLKDQVAALKWVKRNIKAFGGDPDNVTLFGESAGGASVSLHLLSKMSKGLFHKVIIQSGSSLAPWAVTSQPIEVANEIANIMGYHSSCPYEIYSLFVNKTDTDLLKAVIPRPKGRDFISAVYNVPCVERVISDEEPFLTDTPYDILRRGDYLKVPVIIGTNNYEGIFFMGYENTKTLTEMNFEKMLPWNLALYDIGRRKEVANDVKRIYFGHGRENDTISNKDSFNFTKFLTDIYFALPSADETELIVSTSDQPVYSYLFEYSGWLNIGKLLSRSSLILKPGAAHADDILFLFKPRLLSSMFEHKMIDAMTTFWTNFAKIGEPDPINWRPTNMHDPRVQVLGSSCTTTESLWKSTSVRFWRDLYKKYGRKRIPWS